LKDLEILFLQANANYKSLACRSKRDSDIDVEDIHHPLNFLLYKRDSDIDVGDSNADAEVRAI
jgi:hypothetical protein